jgi:hypothetical protein
LTPGGDFVALGLSDDTAQKASLGIHRIDDLHPSMPHFLAVEDDDPILPGSQDLILPAQQRPLQPIIIDLMQEPGKGGLLGAARVAGVRIGSKFQGAQLRFAQGIGVVGQVLGAADNPLSRRHDHQADQPR